jgi:hypothetical protein
MKLLSKIIDFFTLPDVDHAIQSSPVKKEMENIKRFKAEEEQRMAEIEANLYKPTEFKNDKDIT